MDFYPVELTRKNVSKSENKKTVRAENISIVCRLRQIFLVLKDLSLLIANK